MISDQLLDEIAQGQGQKLARLAARVPSNRGGKPVNVSCLFRWCTEGVRGLDGERVFLEAAKGPSGWISTPAAISRFLVALTPLPAGYRAPGQAPGPGCRSPDKRRRAAERAEAELERLGI